MGLTLVFCLVMKTEFGLCTLYTILVFLTNMKLVGQIKLNIFNLDNNPEQAAIWHVDSHVIKMPLEYAQLLSTAHVVIDDNECGYRATHINHPSAIWARASYDNYSWLWSLFKFTSEEYRFRYGSGRPHKSWYELSSVLADPPRNIPDLGFIPVFKAMPAEYIKIGDSVTSYRQYYNLGKRHLHSWSLRDQPSWIDDKY
ncbi:unnamed protein product [Sphagnum jensenii]